MGKARRSNDWQTCSDRQFSQSVVQAEVYEDLCNSRSLPATMSTAAVDPLSQTPLAFVEINGARLAYRIAGNPSDPLIITLHGGRGFGMYSTRGASLAIADVLRRFAQE